MSTPQQQVPKLPIVFIFILTISAIVAPYVIVNTFKTDIVEYQQVIKGKLPQPPKTYKASDFTAYGKAVNDGNWIGNIDKNSGFRFTINSENQTNADLSIKYKSEKQGGILKVNGNTENLYFPATDGNWKNKDVTVKLQQGENYIEFCSGWLTDFAPDIAEIAISNRDYGKNYMVGVWKGTYEKGKGKTTLTINDDRTGVNEFIWQGTKGSHSVYVNYSNGIYTISGKDWIEPKRGWRSFGSFTGTIINGKFSGNGFNLEKTGTVVLLSVSTAGNKPHKWQYTLNTPTNDWYSTSFDDSHCQQGNAPFGTEQNLQNTRWTTSQIFIRTQFNISNVSSIENAYFCVWHDEDVQIYLNGQLALNSSGYITNYQFFKFDKSLLKNGENTIAAKCIQTTGGQLIDIGVFVTTESKSEISTKSERKSTDANQTITSKSNETKNDDYATKVESALSKAIGAFDDGRFSDAFKYYNEAANYPTDRSSAIKQNAAKKFKEKAERIIANNNGECDDLSKQFLDYARRLNPTNEIQQLINKCN